MENFEFRTSNYGTRTPALVFAGVLLLSDQAMKYLSSGSARAYCNPDGPWGIPMDDWLLIAVMTAALSGAAYLFRKAQTVASAMAFALVLVGGLSNLADRIIFGCVRDIFLVSWFPAFNSADVYLTIGAAAAVAVFLGSGIRPERSE